MTITNIEGKVMLYAGTLLLANQATATLVIERPDSSPLSWSIRDITSHVDFDEAALMIRRKKKLLRLSFTPTSGGQSFMGAALTTKVAQEADGRCTIDLLGTGALHGFDPASLSPTT